MNKIGVIGVGNPLWGDDGIGILLMEELAKRKPEGVEFIDGGTGGINLIHVLAKFDLVVILDAVDFGGKCGETRIFPADDVLQDTGEIKFCTHETDLFNVIKISKKLGESPDKIFIFGVQPKDFSPKMKISREIKQSMDRILDEFYNKIKTIKMKETSNF
jgi:hydrogenase maturation protease